MSFSHVEFCWIFRRRKFEHWTPETRHRCGCFKGGHIVLTTLNSFKLVHASAPINDSNKRRMFRGRRCASENLLNCRSFSNEQCYTLDTAP